MSKQKEVLIALTMTPSKNRTRSTSTTKNHTQDLKVYDFACGININRVAVACISTPAASWLKVNDSKDRFMH